jgi:membrane protein
LTTVPMRTAQTASRPIPTSRLETPRVLVRVIIKRMTDDGTFQQAAALAYNTLFSLLPIFVIALLITSIIGGSGKQSMGHQVQGFIFQQLGIDQIKILDTDKTSTDLATFVAARLDKVHDILQSPQTGIIGFATLLWGAISLMMVIERTFSRIYRAKQERPLIRRLLLYWCVLTLGPLGVAASLWLSNNFNSVASNVSGAHVFLAPLSVFAGYVVSFLLLLTMYKLIPEADVQWRSAALGAGVGTVLWEGGKFLFGLYVLHFVGYGKWYGTLGLVPLFMFWIYLTWNFVLLGLEVAYIHQHFPRLARRIAGGPEAEGDLTDIHWVLAVGALLVERFDEGKGLTPDEAAEELHIPGEVAERLLCGLQKNGLAHAIASRDGTYTLSRPPEKITAEDLLAAARCTCRAPGDVTLDGKDGTHPVHTEIAALRKVESDWARNKTLSDLTKPKTSTPG